MEPNAPVTPPPNAPEPEGQPVPPPQPQAEPEVSTAPTAAPAEQPSTIANQFQPEQVSATEAPANADASASALPTNWPGAFGVYKFSKQAVRLNIGPIIGWWLIIGVASSALESALKRPGQLVSYIIASLGTAIVVNLYIAGVRRQKVGFSAAFTKGLQLWLKMFLLGLIVVLSLVLSAVLLLIPLFFVAPRLALANYFLVDSNMGVVEAYKASWHATKGNVGKIYGIFGATLAMALLALTIIGIPFAIYFLVMYSAAYAVLFEFLLRSGNIHTEVQSTETSVPPVAPTA